MLALAKASRANARRSFARATSRTAASDIGAMGSRSLLCLQPFRPAAAATFLGFNSSRDLAGAEGGKGCKGGESGRPDDPSGSKRAKALLTISLSELAKHLGRLAGN